MNERALIVGGGLIGLASGLAVARSGMVVTLVDPDRDRGAASWGNAGHIATEQVEPLASFRSIRSAPRRLFSRGGALALPRAQWRTWGPFAFEMMRAARPRRFEAGRAALSELNAAAMPAWRRLADHLQADGLLREDGHLVVWSSAAAARAGRSAWEHADTGTARIERANDADVQRLSALLGGSRFEALRFRHTGQISDLGRLGDAMEAAFAAAGGRIVRGRARLVPAGPRAGVAIDGGAVDVPDAIVLAAGVGSGPLIAPFGHRAPIIAERGYHLRTTDHRWPQDLPPVVFEDRSMIVTRFGRQVQAASFVELSEAAAPPDPAKWTRLEEHIFSLDLPLRGPFTRWMGSRPTLPDYLPAIGRSARADNLVYAFGHQHLGLTLAPITGEIVRALVQREVPPIGIAAFDLDRFSRKGRTR